MWFHPQLWICWWSDNGLLISVNRDCVNGNFAHFYTECVDLKNVMKQLHSKLWLEKRKWALLLVCFLAEKVFLFFFFFQMHHTEISAVWRFSLALLQFIGVKIPQSHSQVITDASHPRTHTGSWITIFFVRLISLLCLFLKNQAGGIWACVDVQSLMDEINYLQMEMRLLPNVKLVSRLLLEYWKM